MTDELQIPVATIVVRAPGPPGPPGVGNTSLSGLTDTAGLDDATDGQVVSWDEGTQQWVPADQSGGGISDPDLQTIADIDSTQVGVLASDGAGWIRKSWAAAKTALGLAKGDVGLGNVDNTADSAKPISTAQQTALDGKIDNSTLVANSLLKADSDDVPEALTVAASRLVGRADTGGIAALTASQVKTLLALAIGDIAALQATLDAKADLVGGTVPAPQMASYVDDVIEAANFAALPATGEAGKIYVTLDDNKTFRWGSSAYAVISETLALGETSSTAYRGDRGKTAYDHSLLTTGNPHNVTKADVGLANVDNTADSAKPISTAQQTALDGKQAADADLTTIAALDSTQVGVLASDGAGWIRKTWAAAKTSLALTKSDVGLSNVTNVAQQASNADLTAIAGLTPTNDDILQRKAGAWVNRTIAQLKTDLGWTSKQDADQDLTDIAALTPTNDDVLQRKAGAWTNRTIAQLKTDLAVDTEGIQDIVGAMVSGNTETGIAVTYDDAGGVLNFAVSAVAGLAGYQGDGSDGAVVLDGTNTYAGFMSKSGNVYTLTRDLWADTLQVNSGCTLDAAGYGVQVKTSILNNGTIHCNGGNAGNATGGSGGAPGTAGGGGSLPSGSAGGNFSTAAGGSSSALATAVGGRGGAGGAGANAGGTTGTITAPTAQNGRWRTMQGMTSGVIMRGTSSLVAAAAGTGGGGGGGDGTNRGPGGGGGGGWLVICCPTIVNNGVISANGGAGATTVTAGVNVGASGGGGGGFVTVNTTTPVTGSGSITANGGAAGVSNGTGAAGNAGSAGTVIATVWS